MDYNSLTDKQKGWVWNLILNENKSLSMTLLQERLDLGLHDAFALYVMVAKRIDEQDEVTTDHPAVI